MSVHDDGKRPERQDRERPATRFPRREHHHPSRGSERWPPGRRWDPYDRVLTQTHDELVLRRLIDAERGLLEIAGLCGSPEREVGEAVARAVVELQVARDALLCRRPGRRAQLEALMTAAVAQAEERLGFRFTRLR